MCQRHGIFSLITGITKHDALVTCPDIHFLLANVDSTCNVRALLVDSDKDLTSLVTQTLTVHGREVINISVESNLLDDTSHNLLIIDLGLSCNLASNHDHVVFGRSLTGHLALG